MTSNTIKATRLLILTLLAASSAAWAQSTQPQDEEYARLVKQWTTKPEFMSPLVDHLPKVAGVPTPKDVLGYYVGAPKKLTHVADLGRYYRALAAASKRVKILPAGHHRRRPRMHRRRHRRRRHHPQSRHLQRLPGAGWPIRAASADEEAQRIIAQAKPIYMFTGGLHSAETGPPEMLMELAYRLAVDESPLYDQIRRNVIVMMTQRRRARWPRPLRRLVLPLQDQRRDRAGPRRRTALLGQVHLPRQQSRHQLLAGHHAQLAEVLPGMASAHHARPARIRSRSCTPSAARRRRTPRSIRFSTPSCPGSRISR